MCSGFSLFSGHFATICFHINLPIFNIPYSQMLLFFYLMDYFSVQLIRNYFSSSLVTPRVAIVFKLIFSIQMFVELYGENSQSGSFNCQAKVYLKLDAFLREPRQWL